MPEPRIPETHGPYCALCGCCKACSDAGEVPDPWCWDNDKGPHLWNALALSVEIDPLSDECPLPPADPPTARQAQVMRSWGYDV